MPITYNLMYALLLLALVNVPTELIQIFPFTFVLSICFGIFQFSNKTNFQIFITEIKHYICLMLVSSLAILYLSSIEIPSIVELTSVQNIEYNVWIKIYLQLCLFFSVIKISKHSYFLIYNTNHYISHNVEKYLKSLPFTSEYKRLIPQKINSIKPTNRIQEKYKETLIDVCAQFKNHPLLRQKLYDAHIQFIYSNHPILKTWTEVDQKIKTKLERSAFKDLFLSKEKEIPPTLPRSI